MKKILAITSICLVIIGTILMLSLSSNDGRKWILNNVWCYEELKDAINKFCYQSCYYKDKNLKPQQVRGTKEISVKNENGMELYKAFITYNYLSKEKNNDVFEKMKDFILSHYDKEEYKKSIQAIALMPVWHMGNDASHPLFSVQHIRFIYADKDMKFSNPKDCDSLWSNYSDLVSHQVALTQNLDDFFNKRILVGSSIFVILGGILSLISTMLSDDKTKGRRSNMKIRVTERVLQITSIIVLITVAIITIVIYIKTKDLNKVTAFILFCTFTAIMINTVATWILKRLTVKQIIMSTKPVVMCRIIDGTCSVRNIGNGAALYIQSEKKHFKMNSEERKKLNITDDIHYVQLGILPCLEKNSEWHGLAVRMYRNDGKTEQGINGKDQQIILNQFDDFMIEYKDIEDFKYKTLLKKKNGAFETAKFYS